MAKVVKVPDLSAAVVCDTNPLFSENETELIGREAIAELQEIGQTAGIEIIIPRVVAGELLFRKDWTLKNLRNEAAKKLASIGQLATAPQPTLPDGKVLRRRLQRRFSAWCKENRIKLWRVPFDRVNWRRLASCAINRQPPFSPFDPKGKSEKGFRDALILETLCDVHKSVSPKPTVFICGDDLLSGEATRRVSSELFAVYKTTTEYLSYLKLQRQNFFTETIKVVLEEAMSLFYTPNVPDSVYSKFDIPAKLHAAVPNEFTEMPPSTPLLLPFERETFRPVTIEGYRIGATNIEDAVDEKKMKFKTEVSTAQAFQSSNLYASEQLRVITAMVFWTAIWRFGPPIELSAPDFVSVKWEKTAFEIATDERLKSFNLPTKVDRMLASLKTSPPTEESES